MTPDERKEYMRTYCRLWIAKRRRQYFEGKSCAVCKSTTRLELDHIDPALKISHAIWYWKESRKNEELAKCQVLCHECHKAKSSEYSRQIMTGAPSTACRKLPDDVIEQIRVKLALGVAERKLAIEYGVGKTTIHTIKTGETYQSATQLNVGKKRLELL